MLGGADAASGPDPISRPPNRARSALAALWSPPPPIRARARARAGSGPGAGQAVHAADIYLPVRCTAPPNAAGGQACFASGIVNFCFEIRVLQFGIVK